MTMQPRQIFDRLRAALGVANEEIRCTLEEPDGKEGPRDACMRLPAAKLLPAMRVLRDDPELAFEFLQNLTAVDWIKRDVIEVVYHLFSYAHRHSACVKVELPRGSPRLPSVAGLWPAADWLEREQYDLLGVVFEGHPDLRRLLMPDDWVGHPMRKDFHEPKSYRGMPTSRPSPMELLLCYDRAHGEGAAEVHAAAATEAPDRAASPDEPEGRS